jgi:uncharacterized membrane protein YwzB
MTTAIGTAPRPVRPLNTGILLVFVVALAFAAIAWWSIPALTPQPFVAPPALSQNRLLELKASRVFTTRIVGLDVRGSTNGTEVHLVGGYMDADQIVLFMRMDPPGRALPASTTLRDQFGRSYAVRGQVADIATGESITYFAAPGFPLLQTGARFTLQVSEVELGLKGAQRLPASLALSATVLANDPSLGAYVLDMGINYLVLAVAGGVYLALTLVGVRLLRVPTSTRWAYLAGVATGVLFAVIALPTYIAMGALVRHDPIGPGGLQRPLDAYLPATVVVFYAIQVAAVLIGVARSKRIAGPHGRVGLASGAGVLAFLALIQPLAEIANACYIGIGFLLHPSC